MRYGYFVTANQFVMTTVDSIIVTTIRNNKINYRFQKKLFLIVIISRIERKLYTTWKQEAA
jgi:hypothetical protein